MRRTANGDMPWRLLVWMALLLALPRAAPAAHPVSVPLHLDHEFIRQILLSQLYTNANDKAVLWDDRTGCGFLTLREPKVTSSSDRLRLVSRGEARVGTPIGTQCLAPLQWDGFIEVFEEPYVSDDQRELRFRVVDSNIYDDEWKKRFATGKLWDLVKRYVHPRLQTVRIDLRPAIQDFRDLLPLMVGGSDKARAETILDSLHIAAATVSNTGVDVNVTFTVSSVTSLAAPTPEPTLTADELRRWEEAWQHWDAFLTFVVKQVGRERTTKDLRLALADVLLEARYDILEALAPSTPGAPDPTRTLFLKTWARLAPVMRRSAAAVPAATGLRYLSLIAAGDALAAVEQLGPDVGLEISADGLRRLARIVAPLSVEDPLLYSTAVDPSLRALFGLGPPLPPPAVLPPDAGASWWRLLLYPRAAQAVGTTPASDTLEHWLPDPATIDTYLHAVREVLDRVTKQTLVPSSLEEHHHEPYRRLVLATAWQESCWRQFVRKNRRATYLKSPVGSIGMMQVNEHVWRGLYDLHGLRWDITYNGRAGAEILMHYLTDYAIARKEDQQPGGTDNLVRATYAVYNGGPGQLARYRTQAVRRSLKRIDDLFWQKYQAVSAGRLAEVRRCIVGGP